MCINFDQNRDDCHAVTPPEVHQKLDLQGPGPILFLVDGDQVITRSRPASFTATLHGLHQQVWADLDVDEWLRQERSTWA